MGRTTWFRRGATFVTTAMMAGFGLTGIASAQVITNTGPGSTNSINSSVTNNCSVTNNNNVWVKNHNKQTATTGSANVSGNTTAGVSWDGWSGLDPAAAQASGTAYASWMDGVVGWMGQHASGDSWNSLGDNLSWAPSGANWSGFDPMTWQANGQSFGNWYNSVEAYLNANSPTWVMTWPADATGSMSLGGAVSGNATNNNNANFSININNAASAAAGTDSCGHSNFVPPTTSGGGGMGGGPVMAPVMASNNVVPSGGGGGAGGGQGGGFGSFSGGGGGGNFQGPSVHTASAPVTQTSSAPAGNQPSGGGMGGGPVASVPSSSISNTGPGSSNTINSSSTNNSQVTNNNNICVTNYSSQKASSGDANVSGNTTAGSGVSGDAGNGNTTGVGADLTN